METVVKFSALNPLATCFIPSSLKDHKISKVPQSIKFHSNKTTNQELPTNQTPNTITKFKIKKYSKKRRYQKLDICFSSSQIQIYCQKNSTPKLLIENIYFTNYSTDICIDSSKIHKNETNAALFLKLLLLALLNFAYPDKLPITYNNQKENLQEDLILEETCNCPPMFGCIIPSDFFGNPFNFTSSCNKKYVHVCHYSKSENKEKVSSLMLPECSSLNNTLPNDHRENCELQECSSEFQPINDVKLLDVYYDVKETSPNDNMHSIPESTISEHEEFNICMESKENINSRTNLLFEEPDIFNLDFCMEMKMPKAQGIDDFHPLLNEDIWMDDEGELPSITPNASEASFSKGYEPQLSFDHQELTAKMCNPPCSVWCDSLPRSTRETLKRFKKSSPELESLQGFNKRKWNVLDSIFCKPYESYFSGIDSFKNAENIFQLQPNTISELEETSYQSPQTNRTNINWSKSNAYKYHNLQSSDLTRKSFNERVSYFHEINHRTSMWEHFDSADSLWQPLPDCVPSADRNSKQNVHKRGLFR